MNKIIKSIIPFTASLGLMFAGAHGASAKANNSSSKPMSFKQHVIGYTIGGTITGAISGALCGALVGALCGAFAGATAGKAAFDGTLIKGELAFIILCLLFLSDYAVTKMPKILGQTASEYICAKLFSLATYIQNSTLVRLLKPIGKLSATIINNFLNIIKAIFFLVIATPQLIVETMLLIINLLFGTTKQNLNAKQSIKRCFYGKNAFGKFLCQWIKIGEHLSDKIISSWLMQILICTSVGLVALGVAGGLVGGLSVGPASALVGALDYPKYKAWYIENESKNKK